MLRFLTAFSNIFFLQLFSGELLFSTKMERKPHFLLKTILIFILGDILSIFFYISLYLTNNWLLYNTTYYIVIFVFSYLLLMMLFNENKKALFLCATSGYLVQHITAQIILIGNYTVHTNMDITLPLDALFSVLAQLPFIALVYFLFYVIFAKKTSNWVEESNSGNHLLLLAIITIIMVALLSSIRDYYANESLALTLVSRLFSILSCFFLLYLKAYIIDTSKKETEKKLIEQLYYEQQKQFQFNKETIDLINEKCHDMRHQIASAGANMASEELKELISIYDNTIRTGNSTLDTIFSEKSILCQKYGIRLSPMIDGDALAFMELGDICSLFGNILENAIESVSKLTNESDRIISIKVQEKASMLIITCDNYYNETLNFVDGLPISSKDDNDYHGFGLKSIKRIAKKYGGTLTINTDEMFHLIVVIPVQNN